MTDQTISIYKIHKKDNSITDCYVGSTYCVPKRLSEHKANCNNPNRAHYNYPLYRFIRENGGFNEWAMTEIAKCNVKTRNETERAYIETLGATLNKQMPNRTTEEIKAIEKEYNKRYYAENKDKFIEYRERNKALHNSVA